MTVGEWERRSGSPWGIAVEGGNSAVSFDLRIDNANEHLTVFGEQRNEAIMDACLVAEAFPEVDEFVVEGDVVAFEANDSRGNAEGLSCEVFKPRVNSLLVGDQCALNRLMELSGADAKGSLIGITSGCFVKSVVISLHL